MPDIAIVDVRMPPTQTDEGLRAAHEIRARHPQIGIVILSQHVEVGIATRLLAETPEGLGYLLKDRVSNVRRVRRRSGARRGRRVGARPRGGDRAVRAGPATTDRCRR